MRNAQQRKGPGLPGAHGKQLGICLMLGAAGAAMGPAFAQEPAQGPAQAEQATTSFDIPAGDLADALDRYAEQGGTQILYTPELVEGRQAAALSGRYRPDQALRLLLQGSGLEAQAVGDGTLVLRRGQTPAPRATQAAPATMIAAAEPAAEVSAIEEVMVTARRKQERQQDVPLAVTALSGTFLEDNSINALSDLNSHVPALHVDNFNSPTTTNIGIRAVRSTDIAPGQDSAVGVYVAEVNFGYTIGVSQTMYDMQSVEVLKGPQGTLFGRNTTGGAMLLTPARPTGETGYSLSAGSSFFEGRSGYTGVGVLNLPVSADLWLRAGVSLINRDGYLTNVASRTDTAGYQMSPSVGMTNFKPLNDDQSTSWRLSALWRPAEAVESYFLYQGSHLNANGIGYSINALNPQGYTALVFNGVTLPSAQEAYDRIQAERARDFWSTESNINSFNRLDMHVVSNATTWNIDDGLLLKNIVGYRHFERDDSIDFDGLPLQVLEVRHPDSGHEFSEELQMQGKSAGGAFDWVAGLYYAGQVIDRRSTQVVLAGAPITTPVDTDNKTYAAFAQATWRVPSVEGLSLTGGLRYTRDERKQENRRIGADPNTCLLTSGGQALPADDCVLRGEAHYDEPTYSLSADYKFDRDTLVYLAHRRGYRSGGFDYAATDTETFGPFKPEFVTDFELGLKKDWRLGDSLLRTNVAAYTQDYKDIQRFISRPGQPAVGVTNAASATISGGELELTFMPFDGLSLSGFYGLVFAEYDDFLTGEGDFSDNQFAQAPREQLSLSGDWRLPIETRYGNVHLRADWYHQTRVFYTDTAQGPDYGPAGSQYQKAYGLLNLSLAWNSIVGSDFDLSLFARNVGETKTKPFGVQLYRSLGYNISSIGDPRVIGLELNYRFNL